LPPSYGIKSAWVSNSYGPAYGAIEDGLPSDPPQMIPKIEYMDHKQGVESTVGFFPGIEPDRNLPQGLGRMDPGGGHGGGVKAGNRIGYDL